MSVARQQIQPIQISALQLALAVAVTLAGMATAWGAMDQRVAAQERVIAPLAEGDLVRLEEKTEGIARDVAWIRDRMEQAR